VISNAIGREWWHRIRNTALSHNPRGKAREFIDIADEEYRRAIAGGAPLVSFPAEDPRRRRTAIATVAVMGAAGGLVGYRLLRVWRGGCGIR